jgi:mycothiol synthase
MMETLAPTLSDLTQRLPSGFVARYFDDRDREPLVALRNRELHPMQHSSAEEWRQWERVSPVPSLLRVVVEHSGGPVAMAEIATEGPFRQPDRAAWGGVGVAREARRRGIGSALYEMLESEARRRSAPRFLASTNAEWSFAIDWARRRGFTEIGRRIESFVEITRFDPARFADALARTRAGGIRFATLGEVAAARDDAAREELYRELYAVEERCWRDVPMASAPEHPPYETFRKLIVDSPMSIRDVSVLALDGDRIVGMTLSGQRGDQDGATWFTATLPEYRGRGIALAMKVEAFVRAKARGLRALVTTNDEPNKAMRGIIAKLGYEPLPPTIQLEKRLS